MQSERSKYWESSESWLEERFDFQDPKHVQYTSVRGEFRRSNPEYAKKKALALLRNRYVI